MEVSEMGNNILHRILSDFFARIPFRRASIKDNLNFVAENQELVLNKTIFHEMNTKYPLKKSHQVAFVKSIISWLESMNIEVCENLYLTYVDLTSALGSPDSNYVHFSIGNEFISIKEKGEVISNGTTGLAVWEAGKALSNYCINHQAMFLGKNILELGSGLGLCGLSVIRVCQPKCFCFSDCHDEVLEYLLENIHLNLGNELAVESHQSSRHDALILDGTYRNSRVMAVKLQWEDLLSTINQIVKPEIIVASDIVYDLSTIPSLSTAIAEWLRLNTEAEVILSCTVRNSDTLAMFLSFIHHLNLRETVIESVQMWNMSFDHKYDVKIFSIRWVDESATARTVSAGIRSGQDYEKNDSIKN